MRSDVPTTISPQTQIDSVVHIKKKKKHEEKI